MIQRYFVKHNALEIRKQVTSQADHQPSKAKLYKRSRELADDTVSRNKKLHVPNL
jgi:hypothetical protein